MVCPSFEERGESVMLWKQDGMTLDQVTAARRQEAEMAAMALDVHDIQFFDLGDYSLDLGTVRAVPERPGNLTAWRTALPYRRCIIWHRSVVRPMRRPELRH